MTKRKPKLKPIGTLTDKDGVHPLYAVESSISFPVTRLTLEKPKGKR